MSRINIAAGTNLEEVAFRILCLARAGTQIAAELDDEVGSIVNHVDGIQGVFEMIDDLAAHLWGELAERDLHDRVSGKLDREIPF